MDDETRIQGRKLMEFKFSYADPDFHERRRRLPTYDMTISYHNFAVRRRLVRLRFLMRRPRGRRLLGVRTWETQLTLYNMRVDI